MAVRRLEAEEPAQPGTAVVVGVVVGVIVPVVMGMVVVVLGSLHGRNLSHTGSEVAEPLRQWSVRTRPVVLVSTLLASALVVGGCSVRGSDYQYVRSRSTGTYLRIPESWDVAAFETDEEITFARVFDGKKVDQDLPIVASDRPTGFVQVRELSDQERDVMSLELARNAVFRIDDGVQAGEVEVVDFEAVDRDGFSGQRVVFRAETTDGTATIAQIVMLAPGSTRFHMLVVGCTTPCYDDNEKQIEAVIDSLTVKET